MSPLIVKLLFSLLFVLCAVSAGAQMMTNPYGPNISLENAKKAAAPALAEARKNNWTMVVAIVDAAGDLVYYEKMDNTQLDQGVSRRRGGWWRGRSYAGSGRSCPDRRRYPHRDGRQDRRSHRRLG